MLKLILIIAATMTLLFAAVIIFVIRSMKNSGKN